MSPLGLLLVIGIVILGTSGSYMNIEYTINVHDEDVETFNRSSDAKPYYKILKRDANDKIYIGGREELMILDAGTLEELGRVTVPTDEIVRDYLSCADLSGLEVEKLCQNYIRLAEDFNDTTILVCGTNNYDPMCNFVDVDDTGNYALREGRMDGLGKVQYSVVQNSTALLYDQANHRLFVGHNEEGQPNPSHISKFEVTSEDLNLLAQTDDQNEKHINEPHFVGQPFSYLGFIYFFYRETAVEAVNQGKFVYSRVGRVCENDVTDGLSTFFKARLNCSLKGEFPFYFDHIQDVIVEMDENDKPIFYAVFTTTPHGPASAAVCSYRIDDIIYAFENSKFKGKTAIGRLPGPIDRPSYDTKFTTCAPSFTPTEVDYQQDYPLMDQLVPNYNAKDRSKDRISDRPLFYSTQMNLYSVAHDKENDIFYVGTEHGTILKAVWGGDDRWNIYEQELLNVKHPVTGLHYSNDSQSLLVANEQGLYRIDMASCRAYCSEECSNSYSGYCQPSTDERTCDSSRDSISRELRNVDVRILGFKQPTNNQPTDNQQTISSCPSRRVELTCEVKGSEACGEVDLVWKFGPQPGEPLVSCSGGSKCVGEDSTLAPFIQYQEISSYPYYKLVHLSVDVHKEHTNGNFTCEGVSDGNLRKATVEIVISESVGCLTSDTYDERSDKQKQLMDESKALKECDGERSSSDQILFQTCDECPGDVRITN